MALFGGNDQELRVTIRAKDEASKELNKVQTSIGRLAGGFALGTVAVDALRGGFRFLSGVVTDSIKEFEDQNRAIAQMNAVLQSTQHAAGLTAKQLVDMANAMAEATLYTDDQIISAQNLLLTFTNITNDTFPRATQAVLDMSTALGQDLSSSAIQLGKALNNPIEGVSALQRVGVSFNNAQQEMIANLVKSGETLKAQDFILQELEREFGNSAKSAYEAASSVTKLQKNVNELKEDVGSGLTPAINNLFSAFQAVTAGMGRNVEVGRAVFKTLAAIGEFAAATATGIHAVAASLVTLETYGLQVASKMTGISSVMKLMGRDTDQFFTDWRGSLREGVTATSDFYFALKTGNEKVLDTWGELNDEVGVLANRGPAAYQATAEEAARAAKKIDDAKRATLELRRTMDDYKRSLLGDTNDLATAFVDQERKVADIRKELEEEEKKKLDDRDQKRIVKLREDLNRENAALNRGRTIEDQLSPEVSEQRRRAELTDFERSVEDIQRRVVQQGSDLKQSLVLNFNFNDAVAGDAGIMQIIEKAVAQLNREAILTGTAGR